MITARQDPPDWEWVAEEAGRAGRNLVMPRWMELPEGLPLRRYQPEELRLEMFERTCVRLVCRCRVPLYRKSVALIDPDGRYDRLAWELLHHCLTVRVVTQASDYYAARSEEWMEELGASILYSDSFGLCEGALFAASPLGEGLGRIPPGVPVFTAAQEGAPRPGEWRALPPRPVPKELAPWLPHGIAAEDFAGALAQFCRWGGTKDWEYQSVQRDGVAMCLSDLTKYLEQCQKESVNLNEKNGKRS